MKRQLSYTGSIVLVVLASLTTSASANGIASFVDPLPAGGGTPMFQYLNGGHGLYGGWAGPPYINLETPLGTIPDCTMRVTPMFMFPDGRVVGGQITFYMPNQVQILQITFMNGFADVGGLRCGPQTNGTVQFTYYAGGVQLPPGLSEPLQGAWFNFHFHNQVQGPRGPQWTASFTSGAVGQKGDLNCYGIVNFLDINAFVQAMSDPVGYAAAYPWCAAENADANHDGAVNFHDINPFVALLAGG